MIVVSDTSPLNYLILISAEWVLLVLYGQVLVPPLVIEELRADAAPEAVRRRCNELPPVARGRRPIASGAVAAMRVHPGEAQAISLADEVRADRAGRRAARAAGLRVIGTLGVLDYADRRQLIGLPAALDRLGSTNFRAHPRLLSALRDRAAQRRGG